jgi:hypothetical protein
MKRASALILVAGTVLLGGCAADIDSASDAQGDTSRETDIAVRRDALWTEGCTGPEQDRIFSALVEAYYSLQFALDSYAPESNRTNHYFGVGYNDTRVQYRLLDMWSIMHEDLTIVCKHRTGFCDPAFDGKYRWAGITPEDFESGVNRLYVCDYFFDPQMTPGEGDDTSSAAGLLLHEIAHLAGAPGGGLFDVVNYNAVRFHALYSASTSYEVADAYRYFIFNIHNM